MAYVENNARHLPHDGLQCGHTVAVCLVLLYHVENYNNSQNICSDISFLKNLKILHFSLYNFLPIWYSEVVKIKNFKSSKEV